MLQSVSYLQIKPFETYSGKGSHQTTITSFEDMLQEENAAQKAGSTAEEEVEDETKTAEAEEPSSTEETVVYKDPLTGGEVIYQDVAQKAVEQSTSSSTTSAESMKTTKYDTYFKEAAKKYGVSESLLKAIAKAESNFNADDVSSAGAVGVMQLMPETAKSLGVTDSFDPEQNIMGGAKCIAQKLKEFNGDVELALAAYNAGSGAVKSKGGVPSYCKSYVSKVLSYKEAYETAAAVG
jgi:soluble lytic murein transglycosylase-like protein